MRISISTIPHSEQRYPTIGDWFWEQDPEEYFKGNDARCRLAIKVSELGDWKMESMIAIHELWEAFLCKARGIKEEDVTKFDIAFEKLKSDFAYRDDHGDPEPGDQPDAPYQNEHCGATGVERLLCAAYGIKWSDYEKAIQAATD